jgi:hypothetical protein
MTDLLCLNELKGIGGSCENITPITPFTGACIIAPRIYL